MTALGKICGVCRMSGGLSQHAACATTPLDCRRQRRGWRGLQVAAHCCCRLGCMTTVLRAATSHMDVGNGLQLHASATFCAAPREDYMMKTLPRPRMRMVRGGWNHSPDAQHFVYGWWRAWRAHAMIYGHHQLLTALQVEAEVGETLQAWAHIHLLMVAPSRHAG